MASYISDIENRINAAPMKATHRAELICISHVVFYSGIRMDEIGRLKVGDVIDQSGMIRDVVKKFEKELFLTSQVKNTIEEYYSEMKRQRPAQALRRKPFFPTYHNQRTLRRHWQNVNTGYNEIRQAGIKNHFATVQSNSQLLGTLYKKGSERFRLSSRQYQAIVHDKKIPSGTEINDDRCIETLLSLFDKAERIRANGPVAKSEAEKILKEAQEAVGYIKSDKTRKSYSSIIPQLKSRLS